MGRKTTRQRNGQQSKARRAAKLLQTRRSTCEQHSCKVVSYQRVAKLKKTCRLSKYDVWVGGGLAKAPWRAERSLADEGRTARMPPFGLRNAILKKKNPSKRVFAADVRQKRLSASTQWLAESLLFDGTVNGLIEGIRASTERGVAYELGLPILFLMTVFAQALFALVCGNFVTFTFFSARHTARDVMSYEL
jgi:hypothetical protein